MQEPGFFRSRAFSSDGKAVLTAIGDGAVRLWDITVARPLGRPLTHQSAVNTITFRPDGQTVLTGSADGKAQVWDADTGRPIGPPMTHHGPVLAVAYSPDGKSVLTGSGDQTARQWDAASGRPIGLPLRHQGQVNAVAYSPDGKTVLTTSGDQTARLWDLASGRQIGFPLAHQGPINAVAYSPDGTTVLTGSVDKTARLWDANSGRPIGRPMTHDGAVNSVAFSPDGKTLLTGSVDQTARLWNAGSGVPIGPPMPHQASVFVVAFSRDGKSVLTGATDAVRVWDAATGNLISSPVTRRENFSSVSFSQDGRRILIGSADQTTRLWDVATGQPLGPSLLHRQFINDAIFSPDGRTGLTVSGNETLLWDVAELPDDLPRLESWVHVNTGLSLDEQGRVKNLDDAAWREQRDRLASLGGAPPEAEPRWRLDPILFGPDPTARAKVWVERKRWPEAEAAFTEAISARPLDAAVRLERAQFYTSRSQPEKAEEDYARSYALGSRDPKLIDTIVASEPLFRRVVTEPAGSTASLWAKHGELRLSQSRWDEAAADFASELALLPEGRRWDSPRSERALALARWDRAYARLLDLRPDDGQLWSVCGRYHALRGRWHLAAADFARGITSAPPESEEWFEHACLRLIIGDKDGYRTFVQEIRRREGQTNDPFVAYVLARCSILAAETVVEPDQVVRWAESALRDDRRPWYLHVVGPPIFVPAISTRRSSGSRSRTLRGLISIRTTTTSCRTGSCWRWRTSAWVTRHRHVTCSLT